MLVRTQSGTSQACNHAGALTGLFGRNQSGKRVTLGAFPLEHGAFMNYERPWRRTASPLYNTHSSETDKMTSPLFSRECRTQNGRERLNQKTVNYETLLV